MERFLAFVGIMLILAILLSAILSVSSDIKQANAATEDCEQYLKKSDDYLQKTEQQDTYISDVKGILAALSAAYGIKYQNCVARNKR